MNWKVIIIVVVFAIIVFYMTGMIAEQQKLNDFLSAVKSIVDEFADPIDLAFLTYGNQESKKFHAYRILEKYKIRIQDVYARLYRLNGADKVVEESIKNTQTAEELKMVMEKMPLGRAYGMPYGFWRHVYEEKELHGL